MKTAKIDKNAVMSYEDEYIIEVEARDTNETKIATSFQTVVVCVCVCERSYVQVIYSSQTSLKLDQQVNNPSLTLTIVFFYKNGDFFVYNDFHTIACM